MYEELIERLREYPDREETAGGYVEIDWQDLLDAADAIGSLTDQLAAIQAGKAELRDEIRCLRHNVAAMQATLDQQAKNCEKLLAEKDKRIACVEAERDEACEAICDRCDYIPCRREACMWWRGAQGEG